MDGEALAVVKYRVFGQQARTENKLRFERGTSDRQTTT
jgi:hypothetical protein